MMYETFNEKTASTEDRIAWTLCQIIDDDAPMRWTRFRIAAICIANNTKLMTDLASLNKGALSHHCTLENITSTVAHLKEIQENTELANLEDWPTNCGIYALQIEWLLTQINSTQH